MVTPAALGRTRGNENSLPAPRPRNRSSRRGVRLANSKRASGIRARVRREGRGRFCHRWYEQQRGFYASADPVGLRAGLNLFSYAYASPLRFVDPEGLFSVNPHLIWPFSCSFAVAAQARADGSSHGGGRGWRWAHCWASCEISRSCGGPLLAKAFGLLKEVLDLPKCAGEILAGTVVPDGNCDSAFQASDLSDNDFGITCPADKTCDERCGPLIGQRAPHGPFLAPALGAQRTIGR